MKRSWLDLNLPNLNIIHCLYTLFYLQGLKNGPNHESFNNDSLKSSVKLDKDLLHKLLKIIPSFKLLTTFF